MRIHLNHPRHTASDATPTEEWGVNMGYSSGSTHTDTSPKPGTVWRCYDATPGAAVWITDLSGGLINGVVPDVYASDPNPLPANRFWIRSTTKELVWSDGTSVFVLGQSTGTPLIGASKIEGFGAGTVGGSGRHLQSPSTTVYKVTNLNTSGAGSLAAACAASGPRIVVFEVSGTINQNALINITNPYITIAGQTAPTPGITLKGGISVQASNVFIQHMRIRGYAGGPEEGIQLLGDSVTPIKNIVLDHCTVTWTATDELISTAYRVEDVTISNCLTAESLNFRGTLFGGKPTRVSYLRNLSICNQERHPRLNIESGVTSEFHIINNLVYNHTGDGAVSNGLLKLSYVGNVFVDGPDTDYASRSMIAEHSTQFIAGSEVFTLDNVFYNNKFFNAGATEFKATLAPVSYNKITVQPSEGLETYLKTRVGAYPGFRDSQDQRIIALLTNRTGAYITSEATVGGFPSLAQNTRSMSGTVVGIKGSYTYPADPVAIGADGRTAMETFLEQMAADVE